MEDVVFDVGPMFLIVHEINLACIDDEYGRFVVVMEKLIVRLVQFQ